MTISAVRYFNPFDQEFNTAHVFKKHVAGFGDKAAVIAVTVLGALFGFGVGGVAAFRWATQKWSGRSVVNEAARQVFNKFVKEAKSAASSNDSRTATVYVGRPLGPKDVQLCAQAHAGAQISVNSVLRNAGREAMKCEAPAEILKEIESHVSKVGFQLEPKQFMDLWNAVENVTDPEAAARKILTSVIEAERNPKPTDR